jgi:excisionase family DNA binding protein
MPKLLVTPREAANALSICEKTLWSLTKRGELPAVRIGRSVRYDVTDLQAFINGQKGAIHE